MFCKSQNRLALALALAAFTLLATGQEPTLVIDSPTSVISGHGILDQRGDYYFLAQDHDPGSSPPVRIGCRQLPGHRDGVC